MSSVRSFSSNPFLPTVPRSHPPWPASRTIRSSVELTAGPLEEVFFLGVAVIPGEGLLRFEGTACAVGLWTSIVKRYGFGSSFTEKSATWLVSRTTRVMPPVGWAIRIFLINVSLTTIAWFSNPDAIFVSCRSKQILAGLSTACAAYCTLSQISDTTHHESLGAQC